LSIRAYRLAKEIAREPKRTIAVVTPTESLAKSFANDLNFFISGRAGGEVCLFPEPDAIPYTHLTTQPDIWIDRLRILNKLYSGDVLYLTTSIQSFLRKCPPPSIFERYKKTIYLHDLVDCDELSKFLIECGYINQPLVEDEGAFSIRGGIIDIFSPAMERPVRIDLDGDEVASLRTFDAVTQRSSFSISSFAIMPARNVVLNDETKARALGQLKDLCDKNDIKPTERREFAEGIEHNFYAQATETLMPLFYDHVSGLSEQLPKNSGIYIYDDIEVATEKDKLFKRLREARENAKHIERIVAPEMIYEADVGDQKSEVRYLRSDIRLPTSDVRLQSVGKDAIPAIVKKIQSWQQLGLRIILTCHTTTQAERLLDLIRWQGLAGEITDRPFGEILTLGRSNIWIALGKLSGSFVSEEDKLAIITDEEIFGSKTSKRSAPGENFEAFTDFSQLTDNDLVIHKDHGIGRYLGLKNLTIAGTKNDFLELQYLGNDKLFLPVWRINLISRYIGAGGEGGVSLDKLGGTRWSKSVEKVTSAIRTMAMELLKIYATRKLAKGYAFSARDELFEEFEAAFPFDETPDQLRSIDEVLKDMTDEKTTDRLICGDVGYGKTEVAMRAAFKAAADKKQVAILVPTTVLAFQHYENFMSRFANWPVRVEMLSRFRSRTEQKHVVDELSRGLVDIVIGTHRLLQRDIKFADLGLLVIDEEHRFGVAHKERIKRLRVSVDTITMSATPIPRTLHMSLSGIRDISIINTPPVNRLAIRTYVAEFEETLIRGAIMAELSRGGQIFFVHNRVESIEKMHELLVRLVPEAKVVVGHGQMEEDDLEDVMIKFLEKEANILLCTTIIESGLDVPSANTIIINRADALGLAQLYQLRGRVGRSNIQAYAYLLTPGDEAISPIANKRLALLQRYTELGSGFQIAMHDLEIRGAGNILGAQQSGHINAIGYEMYTELLEKTIRHMQGKDDDEKEDIEITLPIPAYIPTDYIEDQGQRLVLYRRLAGVESNEHLDEISKEMEDRYGPIPELAKNLLSIVEIRLLARKLRIESINYDGKTFAYKFGPKTPVKPETILALVKKEPKKFIIRPPVTLLLKIALTNTKEILSSARSFLSNNL